MAEKSKCRSCGAAVLWAITEKGKRIPLDAEPNMKGNTMIEAETVEENGHMTERFVARIVSPLFDGSKPRYMPHHATCPDAKKWRR